MARQDKKYLALIRTLPCMKADGKCQGDICAAHLSKTTNAGKGIKASDCFVTPLCWYHHQLQHSIGEKTFWGGIDNIYKLKEWCLEMYSAREDLFELRRIYMKARCDIN